MKNTSFYLSVISFFIFSILLHPSVIRGRAHLSHAGKIIEAFTYKDFITEIPVTLDTDTIKHDGFFELDVSVNKTMPVCLKIQNVIIRMYAEPDYVYGILIPEFDESVYVFRHRQHFLNPTLVSHDDHELNTLIRDFDSLYQFTLFPKEERFLNRAELFKKIDELKVKSDERYANIKHPYFHHYKEYFLAELNVNVSRGEKAFIHHYLLNRYIRHDDYEMMKLFRSSFKNYLKSISSQFPGITLYRIINEKSSWQELNEWCKMDPFLKKDTLRELVILYNLWDFYYDPDFGQEQIKSILTQMQTATKIQTHKNIIQSMMTLWNRLIPGSPAPLISGLGVNKELLTSEKLKKKWIYLNFFSTRNENSIKEMAKINDLFKKFGHKMFFISIAVDMSFQDYKKFVLQHPQYRWNIWYDDPQLVQQHASKVYYITGNEAYFLIQPDGSLALSPAPAPTEGIEMRLEKIFKPKKKHITGIR